MPKASAPNAPVGGVAAVAADDGHAGSVKPCSGPMMCTMPCRMSSMPKYGTSKSAQFFLQGLDLDAAFSSFSVPLERSVVGTL